MKKIILLIAFLLFPMTLTAQDRVYVVGVQSFKEYLPYSQYQNHNYTGFNREVLDLFSKHAGITLKYDAMPIKRLYVAFLKKRVDFKYPDNPYWQSKEKKGLGVTYSKPVVGYIDGMMVARDNLGAGIEKIKKVAIPAGFTAFGYSDKIASGEIVFTEVFNYRNLLNRVILKRADGVYSNIIVSQYYLREVLKTPNALVFDPSLPHKKSTRHLSTIMHPDIIKHFDAFLVEQKEAVNLLRKKYHLEIE